jgi:tRNA(Ile)-lysidine synthase
MFDEFANKWGFLSQQKLFVACSGGVDSMVLLHLLTSVCKDIEVLHVNYLLRGEDSDSDMNFVEAACQKMGIPFHSKCIDTKVYLTENGGNLQEVARNIRYAFFQEKLKTFPGSYVALGHHSDDQVETFFQHLARKSGTLGLAGMLEIHQRFVRPLLHYSKSDIYDFARKNKVEWREDVSNTGNKYTRNRLRNIFIPQIEEQIPEIKNAVLTLVTCFQEHQRVVEHEAEQEVTQLKKTKRWELTSFQKVSEEVRLEVVKQYGGDYHTLQALTKIVTAQKGKKVTSGNGFWVLEGDYFAYFEEQVQIAYDLVIEEVDELPKVFSKDVLYIDASKIKGKLILRPWEMGDRIKPLGMKGSKLISDILTESKVPNSLRSSSNVLKDEEKIVWCVGYKVAREVVATEHSERILQVRVVEKMV